LINEGLIQDAADLFSLKEGDLEPLERFASKSANNLITNIQAAKKINLSNFIYSLGIRHVGAETAIALANYFGSWSTLQTASKDKLISISDVGDKVANSIYDWLNSNSKKKFLNKLLAANIQINEQATQTIGFLDKKIFVLTGSLESFSREEAKDMIRSKGGKISSSISSNTDYLVVGSEPGSKLAKAKSLSVKILNESDFFKMFK